MYNFVNWHTASNDGKKVENSHFVFVSIFVSVSVSMVKYMLLHMVVFMSTFIHLHFHVQHTYIKIYNNVS
jgi:hypothetical protein